MTEAEKCWKIIGILVKNWPAKEIVVGRTDYAALTSLTKYDRIKLDDPGCMIALSIENRRVTWKRGHRTLPT